MVFDPERLEVELTASGNSAALKSSRADTLRSASSLYIVHTNYREARVWQSKADPVNQVAHNSISSSPRTFIYLLADPPDSGDYVSDTQVPRQVPLKEAAVFITGDPAVLY